MTERKPLPGMPSWYFESEDDSEWWGLYGPAGRLNSWEGEDVDAFLEAALHRVESEAAGMRKLVYIIAAECHKVKWKFVNDRENPLAAKEAKLLVNKAFDDLHRIGDMAITALKSGVSATLGPNETKEV